MKFCIEIDCDSAAFDRTPRWELRRILLELAEALVEDDWAQRPLRDVNGNTVGTAEYRD